MKNLLTLGNVWQYNNSSFRAYVIGCLDDEVLYYHLTDADNKRKRITSIVKCLMDKNEFFEKFYHYPETKWHDPTPIMNYIINKQVEEWDIWTKLLNAKEI